MSILDRYMLRLFMKIFVICGLSLFGLYIVIDMVSNLDDLMEQGDQQGSMFEVLYQYYGARAFSFFDTTSALLSALAAIFAVTWVRKHNELTAIQAAGIPTARIVMPIIVASLCVALLAAASRETLLPKFKDEILRSAQNWDGLTKQSVRARFDHKHDILIGGRWALTGNREIIQPTFHLHKPLGAFQRIIEAHRARYVDAQQDRPSGYLLEDVIKPKDLRELPSAVINGRTVVYSPSDTSWLNSDQCFVSSNLEFSQLLAENSDTSYTSSRDLMRNLRNDSLDYGAGVKVTIHGRLVQPFLDVSLILLVVPVVLSKKLQGLFLPATLCLVFTLGFFLLVLTARAMGANSYMLSPALAAWLPLFLFGPCAYISSSSLWR